MINSKKNVNTNLDTEITNLSSSLNTAHDAEWTSWATTLTGTTPDGIDDQRMKTVYLRTLEYLLGDQDSWTSAEITELQGLAVLCPFEGNTATFKARSLLSMFGIQTYDDGALCSSALRLKDHQNETIATLEKVKSLDIDIYPNPVDEEITINLPSSKYSYQVEVVNSLGQKIYVQNAITSQVLKIDSQKFDNGVFLVIITSNNHIIAKEKIIIQHD